MVFGNGRTALKDPQTMVISKAIADKYYPGQNPVGRVMYIDNDKDHPFRVTAVMVDHIFPYSIPEYVKYQYKKVWYFRWMPNALFRALERAFGWHLCLTAKLK